MPNILTISEEKSDIPGKSSPPSSQQFGNSLSTFWIHCLTLFHGNRSYTLYFILLTFWLEYTSSGYGNLGAEVASWSNFFFYFFLIVFLPCLFWWILMCQLHCISVIFHLQFSLSLLVRHQLVPYCYFYYVDLSVFSFLHMLTFLYVFPSMWLVVCSTWVNNLEFNSKIWTSTFTGILAWMHLNLMFSCEVVHTGYLTFPLRVVYIGMYVLVSVTLFCIISLSEWCFYILLCCWCL